MVIGVLAAIEPAREVLIVLVPQARGHLGALPVLEGREQIVERIDGLDVAKVFDFGRRSLRVERVSVVVHFLCGRNVRAATVRPTGRRGEGRARRLRFEEDATHDKQHSTCYTVLMSRWVWHESPGVRKGPIIRKSDRLTPEQEKRQDHERHDREFKYLNGDHPEGIMYKEFRTCAHCGERQHQIDMRWTGEHFLCIPHYDTYVAERAHRMLR